jgi:hypothetical protein
MYGTTRSGRRKVGRLDRCYAAECKWTSRELFGRAGEELSGFWLGQACSTPVRARRRRALCPARKERAKTSAASEGWSRRGPCFDSGWLPRSQPETGVQAGAHPVCPKGRGGQQRARTIRPRVWADHAGSGPRASSQVNNPSPAHTSRCSCSRRKAQRNPGMRRCRQITSGGRCKMSSLSPAC